MSLTKYFTEFDDVDKATTEDFANPRFVKHNSPGSQKLRKEDKLFIKHYSYD